MKLFLSYSHRDRPFAERLGAQLRALGADVLSDYSSVRPGDDLQAALRDALENADGVILVVPEPGSPAANNAFFEAGAARALGKPVVAVLPNPDPARGGELPADMYGRAVFNASGLAPESLASSIVSALRAA